MARKKGKPEIRQKIAYVSSEDFDNLCVSEYVSLDRNPEIMTACKKIAELIGTMTIHLMENSKKGDVRIVNELSRKIDIEPVQNMTRSTWIEIIVMNMLLYGQGNSVVIPHTYKGIIQSLEPVSASRVSFLPVAGSYRKYRILIDGRERNPDDLLHFVYNPDKYYLWLGKGINVIIRDIANNLKQASATEKGYLESKWKPSLIVKVDSMVDEYATKEGRKIILEDYVQAARAGEPWLIPAEQFQVESVKPLTLKDLAIKDTVELNKKTIASILGVPPFLLGVGSYNREEWNNFIQYTIGFIATSIQQEMTKKLILNPKWYLKFNMLSLYDWDVNTIAGSLATLTDRGILSRNEIRDRLGYSPREGLDDLIILENYLPQDQIGLQKKISGND